MDIATVPFPFVDSAKTKKRKALVISKKEFNIKNGHTIFMMITSATHSKWPSDFKITDLENTGLNKECILRFKIFTIDNIFIETINGQLSKTDQQRLRINLLEIL